MIIFAGGGYLMAYSIDELIKLSKES
jgi:hypothetical protein